MFLVKLLIASFLLCSVPAALANPLPGVSNKLGQACPKEFTLYLGPGSDAQNRTWYFRGVISDGKGTQLSAFADYASIYTIVDDQLVYASNKSLVANTFKADTNSITFISNQLKASDQNWADLRPFRASMDKKTCEVTLKYRDKTVYQRFGFYLNLTPKEQPYTGQIQWFNKPIAVNPIASPDASTSIDARANIVTPAYFYYMEDANGDYIGSS